MKNLIFVILILLTAFIVEMYADDPEPCTEGLECNHDTEYPYRVCDDDEGTFKDEKQCCFSDPTIPYPECPFYEYSEVLIIPVPICLDFDENSGPQETVEVNAKCASGSECPKPQDVYNKIYTQDDCDLAAYKWNCICGIQEDDCACEIKVEFCQDVSRFYEEDDDDDDEYKKMNLIFSEFVTNNDCEIDCETSQPKIIINCSKEFMQSSETHPEYIYFYVNEHYFDVEGEDYLDTKGVGCGYQAKNLTDLITQEVGRMAGLGFYSEPDYCGNHDGLMDSRGSVAVDTSSTDLTNADKCMFMKLYCSEYVSVEEKRIHNDDFGIVIENGNIRISNIGKSGEGISFWLFDALGNQVFRKTGFHSGYDSSLELSVPGISRGIYFYIITSGRKKYCGRLLYLW